MNTHDKLVQYIRKGLRKGFSTKYLKDVLIKHGYREKEVVKALSHAAGGPQKEEARNRLRVLLGAMAIISVILVVVLILSYSNQQRQIKLLSTQVELTHEAAEAYLAQLDQLNLEIEQMESSIVQQIEVLRAQDQPEVKNLLDEIEDLHNLIKAERKETRDLLWDLLNNIIERGQRQEPDIIAKEPPEEWEFQDLRHTSK